MATTRIIDPLDPAGSSSEFPSLFDDAMRKRSTLDYVPVSANYTAAADDHVIYADASSGALTISLPPVADADGRVITVHATSVAGGNVTIDGNASETINGAATKVLSTQYSVARCHCHGGVWSLL